jgi:hypothetical protein
MRLSISFICGSDSKPVVKSSADTVPRGDTPFLFSGWVKNSNRFLACNQNTSTNAFLTNACALSILGKRRGTRSSSNLFTKKDRPSWRGYANNGTYRRQGSEVQMRSLVFALLMLLSAAPPTLAQDNPPNGTMTVKPPKGYEKFFTEIGKVMQSYPDAAKRFRIIDAKVKGELHQCPEGQIWTCIEVCSDWPHCQQCSLWGCQDVLQ